MFNRRDFIKLLSLSGATILTPFRWMNKGAAKTKPLHGLQGGELYAGFILLSEDQPVPEFVEYPQIPIPDGCGVEGGSKPSGKAIFFDTPTELAKNVDFRVYLPNQLPNGFREGPSYTFSNLDGTVYEAWLAYEAHNPELDFWETVVFISIQLLFPTPLPVWSTNPLEQNNPGISFDKVDFLPTAGLQTIGMNGSAYYWIDKDILYKLVLEPSRDDSVARSFIDSLRSSQ